LIYIICTLLEQRRARQFTNGSVNANTRNDLSTMWRRLVGRNKSMMSFQLFIDNKRIT